MLTPPQPSKKSPFSLRRLLRTVAIILFIYMPLFSLVVLYYDNISLPLWFGIIVSIVVIFGGYVIIRDLRTKLQQASLILQFSDITVLHQQVIPWMNSIGFQEQYERSSYAFTLTSKGQWRFGPLAFPPQSWCDLHMHIADTMVKLDGKQGVIDALTQMILYRFKEGVFIATPDHHFDSFKIKR